MRMSTILASVPLVLFASGPLQAQEVLTGEDAFGTWEPDAPGVRRHITPADLPSPSHAENDPEAPDFENMAEVVPAPEGAMPQVPEGFQVEVFATGLDQPRVIRVAPNGDIFVAETGSGRVLVYASDAAANSEPETFSEGLDRPFGIAFFPPEEPTHVYVASADKVVRWGRPTGLAVAQDGSLLVSDDTNGTIFRVTATP